MIKGLVVINLTVIFFFYEDINWCTLLYTLAASDQCGVALSYQLFKPLFVSAFSQM